MPIGPYPWSSLERVPRVLLRRVAELREHQTELLPEALEGVLSALVGTKVECHLEGFGLGAPRRRLFELGLRSGASSATLGAEPGLGLALLERILARELTLPRVDAEIEPALAGALAALAVEVARRLTREPIELATDLRPETTTLRVDVTVRVDGRAYAAYALVTPVNAPTLDRPRPKLDALGDLMLAVPVVMATSLVTPGDLKRLAPGAAFLPGERAWVDRQGAGRAVLAAATAERGVWVDLPADGRLVLTHDLAELAPDRPGSGDEMEADDVNETLADAALEAPVVVRVELGAVSMTASDWARLRPGDVIETGRRIAEPVLLRIAGRVVARGELCDVEGEVGVRVRELVGFKPER
ncbi:MAG TPA: FliM/FliN family flagellar motor switch protein [Polyangiaceae bacterium]|nr:FliM/FliN family flagellar motor switch protein [Polyangiaceae bacterium]